MKCYDCIEDLRSNCISIFASMSLQEYKLLVKTSFEKNGNLEGQRGVIKKSTTANKIRTRMKSDFNAGAVFPPVVLGLLVDDSLYSLLSEAKIEDLQSLLEDKILDTENISVIDGMQRTNIYFNNDEDNQEREIRLEFWIATRANRLLYRMLVLNTGQLAWNTRRQVELIFGDLARSVEDILSQNDNPIVREVKLTGIDDKINRTKSCIYPKSYVIDMYLAFNTRKEDISIKDELADEYQRFDMIQSVDSDTNFGFFTDAFISLCKLDYAICNVARDYTLTGQFIEGKDLFASLPACIGFIVACAEYILGPASVNRNEQKKLERKNQLEKRLCNITELIKVNDSLEYLGFERLNQTKATQKDSRIGSQRRMNFKNSFKDLINCDDLDELSSLEDFWSR